MLGGLPPHTQQLTFCILLDQPRQPTSFSFLDASASNRATRAAVYFRCFAANTCCLDVNAALASPTASDASARYLAASSAHCDAAIARACSPSAARPARSCQTHARTYVKP